MNIMLSGDVLKPEEIGGQSNACYQSQKSPRVEYQRAAVPSKPCLNWKLKLKMWTIKQNNWVKTVVWLRLRTLIWDFTWKLPWLRPVAPNIKVAWTQNIWPIVNNNFHFPLGSSMDWVLTVDLLKWEINVPVGRGWGWGGLSQIGMRSLKPAWQAQTPRWDSLIETSETIGCFCITSWESLK